MRCPISPAGPRPLHCGDSATGGPQTPRSAACWPIRSSTAPSPRVGRRRARGGIVNAVVTGSPPDPIGLDPALIVDCGQWRLSGGHTSGSVTFIAAPAIDGAGDGRTVHRDHDRRRGRHRNSFPRRHLHRLPGRLRRIHHRGHRPRITESSTRTGFRGGIAGENGVGVTGLSRGVRVHWRRCSPRERRSASRASACWPHVASRPRRISRTPTSPTSRIVRSSFGPPFKVTDVGPTGIDPRLLGPADAADRDEVRAGRLREVRRPAGRAGRGEGQHGRHHGRR